MFLVVTSTEVHSLIRIVMNYSVLFVTSGIVLLLVFCPNSKLCSLLAKKYTWTRMHSSRMRTARLLTVSQHALPGVYLARGSTCPGGCISAGGVPAWAAVCTCPEGCTCPGTPPPVNRMTDRCKNITLPQTSFAGGKKKTLESVLWRYSSTVQGCCLCNI